MTNEITKINPAEYGLEETKAQQMTEGLNPILSERIVLAEQYEQVITMELTDETLKLAKELRIKIRDNRTKGIESWHKANKEFYLRGGQFVDAIKKKEVFENERMESNLLEIEKHFENLEKQRQEDLHNSRIEQIKPYVEDLTGLDFRTMQDDVFNPYLASKIKSFEDKKEAEKKEAERIESERLAEIERQKQIEIENAKVKAENERLEKLAKAKDLQLQKEREESEAKQMAMELQLEKEREENERKAKEENAKQDAIFLEQKRIADIEAKKQADIIAKQQAELQAKKDTELKAQKEREESERKAKIESDKLAKAPIKKQLIVWVDSFEISKTDIDNETSRLIKEKFESFKTWALSQLESI